MPSMKQIVDIIKLQILKKKDEHLKLLTMPRTNFFYKNYKKIDYKHC